MEENERPETGTERPAEEVRETQSGGTEESPLDRFLEAAGSMPGTRLFPEGVTADGQYRILKREDSQGPFFVCAGEKISSGAPVTVRVLDRRVGPAADITEDLEALKKRRHPQLPRILDICEEDGRLFIIQERVAGVTVEKLIESGERNTDLALWLFVRAAELLRDLHSREKPVILRVIKPATLVLCRGPRGETLLRMGDAGTGWRPHVPDATVLFDNVECGAPEQERGEPDARSDIWALGSCMYWLLAGSRLTASGDLFQESRAEQIPRELRGILAKCLEAEPEARYQSAEELLADLGKLDVPEELPWQEVERAVRGGAGEEPAAEERPAPRRKNRGAAKTLAALAAGFAAGSLTVLALVKEAAKRKGPDSSARQ